MTISREARFKPAREATVQSLDDRGVIVDMRTGRCWELNQVGFAIWTLVGAGASAADTVAAISARFAVPHGTSETDVLAFLQSLLDAGLLVADASPSGASPTAG